MIKKTLRPALFVMNRLGYPTKFLLISVLFLCPIALLSIQLWVQLEKDIQVTANELEGIEIIRSLSTLQQEADKALITLLINEAFPTTDVSEMYAKNKASVEHGLAELTRRMTDHRVSVISDTQINKLKTTWEKSVNQRLGTQYMMPSDYYNAYGALSFEIDNLIRQVAKVTGLSTDFSPEVEHQYNLLFSNLYELMIQYKILNVFGVYSLNTQHLSTEIFNIVDNAYSKGLDNQSIIQERIKEFVKTEQHPALKTQLENLNNHIASFMVLFDDQIMTGYGDRLTWEAFDTQAKTIVNTFKNIETLVLKNISVVVKKRLSDKKQNRIILVSGLLILLAIIAYLYFGLYYSMLSNVNQLAQGARLMAAGDMRISISTESRDELAELIHNFSIMSEQMRSLIQVVSENMDTTVKRSDHVQHLASDNNQMIREQQEETNKIGIAMEQMASAAEEVAKEAELTALAAAEADSAACTGQSLIQETVNNFEQLTQKINWSKELVERLSEQSRGVTSILVVIKDIANQTNLLALNAAIEAARAGEKGRGFAVVAGEVRTLAQRSHEATVEIEEVLNSIQIEVSDVVNSMDINVSVTQSAVNTAQSLGNQLQEILNKVTMISGRTQAISAATFEQTQAVIHVKDSVRTINDKANESALSADNTVNSTKQMNQSVEHLKQQLQKFRV